VTSRIGYFLAAILLLAGLGGAGYLVWSGLSGIGSAIVRVVVPGSGEMTLDEPGTYTIYHETESIIDGRVSSVATIDGLSVTVTEVSGGGAIPVTAPGMHATYTIGGHSGVSVLAFDIARPGRYRFGAAYDDGRTEPKTVLAVDRGLFGRLLRTILVAIGSVFAGFIAALTLALTTYFRRRRLARAAA
jgi:hypothetical protein